MRSSDPRQGTHYKILLHLNGDVQKQKDFDFQPSV